MTRASKFIALFTCLAIASCASPVPAPKMDDLFIQGTAAYDAGDYRGARAHWQALADNYDLAALRNIGHLYRRGLGVEKDLEIARTYYRRAARLGFAPAQFNLAMMYFDPEGIGYDGEKARKWLALAAAQNYPPAVELQQIQGMPLQNFDQ